MYVKFALQQVLSIEQQYRKDTLNTDGSVLVSSVLGSNSIFSLEELNKLNEALNILRDVKDNYRQTHYELRSKIK